MAQPYGFEKLYLAKGKDGKPDVCVERCPLIQHQLDGIRFLYKAWIKKRPGAILNDPTGYGKRVQTTLFLSAILPLLDKAVLILCRDGHEQLWIDHFQTWTQVSGDVSVEVTNLLTKKKVVIAPSYAAAGFARREWALLVVDGDLTKDVVKAALRADMKVWLICADIKKDLSRFSTFFSWLHPKERFAESIFKANEHDLKDVLVKGAMLDAYMEDWLMRRSNLELPYHINVPVPNKIVEPITNVTKKNKDSTGTKIKRTKRKTVDKSEDAPRKNAKTINNVNDLGQSEIFDMGNINVSNLDVSKGLALHDSSDDECITMSNINKRSKKSKLVEWDSDSDSEIPANKLFSQTSDVDKEVAQDTRKFDAEIERNEPIFNHSLEISSQTNVYRLESDTDVSDEDLPKNTRIGANNDEFKESEITTSNNNEIANLLQDTEEIEEIETKYSEDIFSTDFTSVDEKNKQKAENIIEVVTDENNKITEDEQIKEGILPSNSIDKGKNESIEQKPTETIQNHGEHGDCTENLKGMPLKNASLSDFDLKMKKLEEMTQAKFKGSLLDSIF